MINSRDINELTPETQELYYKFKEEMDKAGIDFIVTSTFRDKASQDDIFAQGRTKPGIKATYARGGWSFHQYRLAFDIAIKVDGKVNWKRYDLYNKAGEIGKKVGLTWGGSFGDTPHFQNHKSLKISSSGLITKYPNGEMPKTW